MSSGGSTAADGDSLGAADYRQISNGGPTPGCVTFWVRNPLRGSDPRTAAEATLRALPNSQGSMFLTHFHSSHAPDVFHWDFSELPRAIDFVRHCV